MALFFLVPLCTALLTGYLVKQSTDEIAYIAGVFGFICFILSLVLAPWQVQLLMLVVVVISTNKLLSKNEYQLPNNTDTEPKNDTR
jgi:Zn-dependent protease with chaperone function